MYMLLSPFVPFACAQVANYPFTTRGITMGHIYVQGTTYQVRSEALCV